MSSAAGRSTPGLTGFACVWLFRRDLLGSVRALLLRGILPGLGGLVLVGAFMLSTGGEARPGGRPGRAGRRAGRRKVAVLEAAGRVIAERGADATRFADVAAESGVPVSTLQYYFGSRESLLVAAFRHASGTEIAALESDLAALDDPWQRLAHIVASALRGYQAGAAGSGRLWIESWHFGIRNAEMRSDAVRDYAAWRRLVTDVIRGGSEAGNFAPRLSPERIAVLTIALVDGVGIPLALGDPEITADGAAREVLAALRELLGAGGPLPG